MKKGLIKLSVATLMLFGIISSVQNISANTKAVEPEYYYDMKAATVGVDGYINYIQWVYDYWDFIQLGEGYYNSNLRLIEARFSCDPYGRTTTLTFDGTIPSGFRYYNQKITIQF